jgi:hypothetical protein
MVFVLSLTAAASMVIGYWRDPYAPFTMAIKCFFFLFGVEALLFLVAVAMSPSQ